MRIVGRGLIATAMAPFADRHADAVIFASGVSDSSCTDPASYERERALLRATIDEVRASGLRIVYFSSGGAAYGTWTGAASERTPTQPRSAYGLHKVATERLVFESGVPALILRLPNVVGDVGHWHQLIPSLVAQVVGGRVTVHRRAARDIVDAGDVGRMVDALLDVDLPERAAVVNLASGRSTDAADLVDMICGILGLSPRIELVDAGAAERFDVALLRRLLGVDAITGIDDPERVLARHVPTLARRLDAANAADPGR